MRATSRRRIPNGASAPAYGEVEQGRPDGGPPRTEEQGGTRAQHIDDLAAVAAFTLWHEPRDMFGARTADEAFHAFCRLLHLPPNRLRTAILPDD